MPYDPRVVEPMREELTRLGVRELRTAEEVDDVLGRKDGTTLIVVNSVCGCAAGNARPAVALALQHEVRPDLAVTVFAGQDLEATERAREYFSGFRPSSPSIALQKDGELVFMLERHQIEGRDAAEIARDTIDAFDRFCGDVQAPVAGNSDDSPPIEFTEDGQPIEFTDAAMEQIRTFMEEDEATDLALSVSVRNSSPLAPEYELSLIEPSERKPDDQAFRLNGLEVVIDAQSLVVLRGTQIDWVETVEGGGFKFENPNLKRLGSEPLTGSLVDKVQRVIEERINPGIASHGGSVSLVDIRDKVVYLRMSGGCQGCGMAAVTLKRGIEEMIRKEVPEIVGIQDATDHAAGTNPYF